MKELEVRMVKLEPMRVATALGFGESPEMEAWQKILTWAEKSGQLEGPYMPRFFGFNNPNPTTASPNYGYEQWMTVGPDVVGGSADVEIKEFTGGLYAVARFKGLDHIGRMWQELVKWVEENDYEWGPEPCLEELLTPPDVPIEEYIFDLYMPVLA